MDTEPLAGRVAFVTGAARGIGRAIALALPEGFGAPAAFLASPAAGFISGVAVPCDGGVSNAAREGLDALRPA